MSEFSLHVEKLNSNGKTPFFLLHGWGHSIEQYRQLGELLTPYGEVYLFDLPGFGKSSLPPSNWSTFDYAKCINDYMAKEGIPFAYWLGHSFGGKVALSAAVNHPNRVKKLVLLASSGLRRKRTLIEKMRLGSIKLSGKVLKKLDQVLHTTYFQSYFIPKFGSTDYQKAGALRPILVKTVNEDFSEEIKKIKTPTYILWGAIDTETPVEMAYRFKSLIPNATLKILEQHGHDLVNDVGSHLCAYHLIPFLKGAKE